MLQNMINYSISRLWNHRLKIIIAIFVFIIIYIIFSIIINKITKRIETNNIQNDEKYSRRLANLIWRILFIAWLILNILIICEILWVDTSLLMAWISLWIWFAMETFISNVVSWFFIILNKKFRVWDSIEILWDINTKWVVEEINLKHTIIRTIDKRRLLIPNNKMGNTPIKTYKTENIIRWDLSVSVPRYVNIDQVKNIINETVNSNENVLNKWYTSTYIQEFDEKWYKFNTIFFVDPHKITPFIAWTKIRLNIIETFKKYWIKVPYDHIIIDLE